MLTKEEALAKLRAEWEKDRAHGAIDKGFALIRDRQGRLGVLVASHGQIWEVYNYGRVQTTKLFRDDEAAKRAARTLYERYGMEEF